MGSAIADIDRDGRPVTADDLEVGLGCEQRAGLFALPTPIEQAGLAADRIVEAVDLQRRN